VTKVFSFFILPFLIFFISFKIHSNFIFPFPPFNQLIFDIGKEFSDRISYDQPLGSKGGFRDFIGLLFGARRLTADIAWLSVLQYYGSHEKDQGGEESHSHEFGGGEYDALKKMVLRVVRLDPSLYYATLYGAGALAFNLNRPNEAMEILEEGIKQNPFYWRFQLYVGAIIYKQKGQLDNMVHLLENAIRYPDCPTMIKSILANIYRERGNDKRALEIWLDVYESGKDPWYVEQAKKQIEELRQKLGSGV